MKHSGIEISVEKPKPIIIIKLSYDRADCILHQIDQIEFCDHEGVDVQDFADSLREALS